MPSGLQHFQISSLWDKGYTGAVADNARELGRHAGVLLAGILLATIPPPADARWGTPALVSILGQVGLTVGKDWPWRRTVFGEELTMEKGWPWRRAHTSGSLGLQMPAEGLQTCGVWRSLCFPNLHCQRVPPLEGMQGSGRFGNRRNLNNWALASMDILCFA